MKNLKEECSKWEALLDDYVDGNLDTSVVPQVESHLVACPECTKEVEALRRLLAAAAELPRSLAPANDLWMGIAGRLEPRPTAANNPRRPWQQSFWLQAVAALLLLVLGAFLGRLAPGMAVPETGSAMETSAVVETSAAVEEGASAEMRLASWQEGTMSDGFGLAEAEFLRAKETLWLLALRRQDDLSPVTRKVVERNLRILDKAIEELRAALENDPGNPELENLLLNHHRRGVGLLERLTRTEV